MGLPASTEGVDMDIYLLRHGEKMNDDKNNNDLELTSQGFLQANLLGKRLQSYNIQRIYVSGMKRAIQTAEEINKYTQTEIVIRPELREIHMGASETKGWSIFEASYPEFWEEFKKHETDIPYPPDGESGSDVWKRASAVLDEIVGSKLENAAVVAHGGTIRILLCGMLGIGMEKRFYLGKPVENCSITLIKYDQKEKKFFLHSFNDCAHLENSD
jgi:probable phosphoglycerate mutase